MTNNVAIIFKKGTTAQNDAFTGASGVVSIDTDLNQFRLHDGSTVGGIVVVSQEMVDSIQLALDTLVIGDIDSLQTALDDKVDDSDVGVANGLATLDAQGRLTQTQLPDLAIVEFLGEVADQTAMLALTGQRGDWITRTDTSTVWILIDDDASILSNWKEIYYPASAITSVNGQTGVVVIDKDDVGLGNVDDFETSTQPEVEVEDNWSNDSFITPLSVSQLLGYNDIVLSGGDTIFGDAGLLPSNEWWESDAVIAFDADAGNRKGTIDFVEAGVGTVPIPQSAAQSLSGATYSIPMAGNGTIDVLYTCVIDRSPRPHLTAGDLTFEMWAYFDVQPANTIIISPLRLFTTGYRYIDVSIWGTFMNVARQSGAPGTFSVNGSSFNINDWPVGQWFKMTLTLDYSQRRFTFYIDDVEMSTLQLASQSNLVPDGGGTTINEYVPQIKKAVNGNAYFDRVQIYPRII